MGAQDAYRVGRASEIYQRTAKVTRGRQMSAAPSGGRSALKSHSNQILANQPAARPAIKER
jgi:hypothetical protein